jgi:DNA-binding transcriptional ArsR family regulator
VARRQGSLVDERLAKALSHPMRAEILAILNDQVASPNEIAGMLDERLPNVSYHVRALHDLGTIELVRTAQRRGAIEHYYRAVVRPFFSDRDWKRLPHSARQTVSDRSLQEIWKDVSDAVGRGTFDRRADRHLSRMPLVVDEQGWSELVGAMRDLVDQAERIGAQSKKRLAKSDEERISARVVLMAFEPGDD